MALRPSSFNTLLKRHGKDCTLTVITEGTYDPSIGSSTSTETEYTVRCHPANYTTEDKTLPDVVLGSRRYMVQSTDTSGNEIPKPSIGNTISGFGDKTVIQEVDELYSLGVVFYLCRVKE